MYNLNIKSKFKTFFLTYTSKEKPENQYYGKLWTAKSEIAVRYKIRDWLGPKYEIKRLEEIPYSVYFRLARLYNFREQRENEERKKKASTGEGLKALEGILEVMSYIQSVDPDNYYFNEFKKGK